MKATFWYCKNTKVKHNQEHIDETDDEEIKKILDYIRNDGKGYFAELARIIRELDGTQEEKFRKEEA